MKRIVYTVALKQDKFAQMALGLARSLSLIGDMTPRVIYTDLDGYEWDRYFDKVVKAPQDRDGLEKLTALDLTDADEVLALDCDMLAFKRLDPIFDYCKGSNLSVQGVWINDGKWHGGDVPTAMKKFGVDRVPKFNGGLIYYERKPEVQELFTEMRRVAQNYDETGFDRFRYNKVSEEVCVLHGMLKHQCWKLIPDHFNFQNTGTGLVGKLHLDVFKNECRYVCRRYSVQYIEPYIFHAHFHRNFIKYWRQLDKLAWLADYEKKHGFGYMPPLQKLRRSIERRYLKYIAKKL